MSIEYQILISEALTAIVLAYYGYKLRQLSIYRSFHPFTRKFDASSLFVSLTTVMLLGTTVGAIFARAMFGVGLSIAIVPSATTKSVTLPPPMTYTRIAWLVLPFVIRIIIS